LLHFFTFDSTSGNYAFDKPTYFLTVQRAMPADKRSKNAVAASTYIHVALFSGMGTRGLKRTARAIKRKNHTALFLLIARYTPIAFTPQMAKRKRIKKS